MWHPLLLGSSKCRQERKAASRERSRIKTPESCTNSCPSTWAKLERRIKIQTQKHRVSALFGIWAVSVSSLSQQHPDFLSGNWVCLSVGISDRTLCLLPMSEAKRTTSSPMQPDMSTWPSLANQSFAPGLWLGRWVKYVKDTTVRAFCILALPAPWGLPGLL